jgi:hypothetical protein
MERKAHGKFHAWSIGIGSIVKTPRTHSWEHWKRNCYDVLGGSSEWLAKLAP